MFERPPNALESLLHRPRPSLWQQFRRDPCVFLARQLYIWRQNKNIPAQRLTDTVAVVCVSDTHNSQPALPHGDILIHAGDLTQSGTVKELQAALDWLRVQSHRHKIVIAGNHDLLLDPALDAATGHEAESDRASLDWGDIIYLHDSEATITCDNGRRLRVFGSPKSCRHGNWAFQYPRAQGRAIWASTVPEDIDILITHGPPRGHLDLLRIGCPGLLQELWRVRPALHVFGHVHEGHGSEWLQFDALQEAYERTVVAGGGLWNFTRVLGESARTMLLRRPTEAKCLLVNPSVVGGLRDDERRRPIQVCI